MSNEHSSEKDFLFNLKNQEEEKEDNEPFNFEYNENELNIDIANISKELQYDLNILNDEEYKKLFNDYLEIKNSKLNTVYSNPIYFLKKIYYFYYKSTFLDCYFLKLKDNSKNVKVKSKDNFNEFIMKIDTKNNKIEGKIFVNEKIFIPFKKENEFLKLKINKISNNMIQIPFKYEASNKNNSFFKEKKIKEINISKNKSYDKINSFLTKSSQSDSKKESPFNSTYKSQSLSLLSNNNSYSNKDSDYKFKIIKKENNDNFLGFLNSEKIGGENYESIAIKNFEIICNIALDKIINVENFIHKDSYKINKYFQLENEKKIDNFQIDAYIRSLTGEELKIIFNKYEKNFFFQEDMKLDSKKEYEIFGEIAINILSQAKQKIKQQYNYIHLIKLFNNYENKNDILFKELCKEYNLNSNKDVEKIFILLTDGSYIILKSLIDLIKKNSKKIENLIDNLNKGINDKSFVIKKFKEILLNNHILEILDIKINVDKFYNLCLFYYNLKNSGLNFCILFISDIIEDKYENKIEEAIKYFIYNDNEKLTYEVEENKTINNENLINKEKKKAYINEINELIKRFKVNEINKINLSKINDVIVKYIKKFHEEKSEYFSQLENNFNKYMSSNFDNFNILCNQLIENLDLIKILNSIIKKKIYINFIFVQFKNINENMIKKQINESQNLQINFDVIINKNINIMENLKKKYEKNLLNINLVVSNNPINLITSDDYIFYVIYINDKKLKYNFYIQECTIIQSCIREFLNDLYEKNKTNFNKNDILKHTNIIDKIKYDLDFLFKEIKNKKEKPKEINYEKINSFIFNENCNEDQKILSIGKNYYDNLILYIENLLNIIINKNSNYNEIKSVLNLFKNEKNSNNFILCFKSLIENWKCKVFYQYFWNYLIKKLSTINNEMKSLELDNIS